MAFVTVAAAADVPLGRAKPVTVNGRRLVLVQAGGRFYALEDNCPHKGAPLSEGDVEGTELVCPWHGAAFDLATGAALCPPAQRGVATFPVQVVDGAVQVDVG
jgi:3-phenylpropionate/trans-cinnamate dioxygenase ferredoxin subunit